MGHAEHGGGGGGGKEGGGAAEAGGTGDIMEFRLADIFGGGFAPIWHAAAHGEFVIPVSVEHCGADASGHDFEAGAGFAEGIDLGAGAVVDRADRVENIDRDEHEEHEQDHGDHHLHEGEGGDFGFAGHRLWERRNGRLRGSFPEWFHSPLLAIKALTVRRISVPSFFLMIILMVAICGLGIWTPPAPGTELWGSKTTAAV